MPNIPPRGLYARNAGAWKNPSNIYARVAGEWKPAVAVYAMRNGVWQLLWASTAGSPATVTIAYVTGQVNGTIVPSTPAIADAYNVYRPDNSLVGTFAAPGTTFVDTDPRPLNGAYTVFGVLGGVQADTGRASNVLDLRLQAATFTGTVINPGVAGQTIDFAWTPSAVGSPDMWDVFRVDAGGAVPLIGEVAGNVLVLTDIAPPAGLINDYRLIPVLSGIGGLEKAITVATPPNPPVSVTLAASGVSNLRLTWAAPAGTVTAYEVETSTDNTTWTASADDVTPADWATSTTTGYMRVRSIAAGGVSAWVTKGPVAAITDATPPPNVTITSWKPESSYGRMVVRFTTPSTSDLNSYLVQQRLAGGTFVNVGSWVTAANSTAYGIVCATRSAGQVAEVRVLLRDDALNQNTGTTASYTLATSPITIDPSGDKSGTSRNGGWRNDSSRASNEIATGWTSSGPNIGCYFYGTTIDAALGNRTIVSALIEYWRENEGGNNVGIKPLFWLHDRTGRSMSASFLPDSKGIADATREGSAVARTGTTGGNWTMPAAFIAALQDGSMKGLCMYRNYQGSGDPDTYYMLMSIGDVGGGSPAKTNGRLIFTHLG